MTKAAQNAHANASTGGVANASAAEAQGESILDLALLLIRTYVHACIHARVCCVEALSSAAPP